MRLVYFVHNLNDPAVAKRLAMLSAAGVEPLVAGFWRDAPPPARIGAADTVGLGETFDAAFAHRALASLHHAFLPRRLLARIGEADIFMARNLETLAIAVSAARRATRLPAIVYEVLDIHRLLLPGRILSPALRAIERELLRQVDLVIVSSEAFVREYFQPFQFSRVAVETALVENKILELSAGATGQEDIAPGPPWHIGWFGALRCRRSLAILSDVARHAPGLLKVHLRGRPSREVLEELDRNRDVIAFGGPYLPADLPRLYQAVHFNWAIDYFEADGNSRWLLPNRIYEGGRHGAVPLAIAGTETAQWLKAHGLGMDLKDPATELESFLKQLAPEAYRRLKAVSLAAPRSAFIANQQDCDRLGRILSRALTIRRGRSRLPVAGGLKEQELA